MESQKIMKQSSFSRSLVNDYKMGAYYTDLDHCKRIGHLFSFPEDEVCILEPSIGDGKALLEVIGKTVETGMNKIICGVELNNNTYEAIKGNTLFNYLINEDFLNGVKISNGSFSFCFSNPPYGQMQDGKERYETKFVEKIYHKLCAGGILALVIPFYTLNDDSFLKPFFARFNPIATYRFDDNVYKQFQQVVVIAQKRLSGIGYMTQWLVRYKEQIAEKEMLAYLPKLEDTIENKINISTSMEKNIEYFTTLAFDAKSAALQLSASNLYRAVSDKISVPIYSSVDVAQPPVPLSTDLLYLCAVSGGGQGLAGNVETNDLHLQRGVAKVVKETKVVTKENDVSELIENSFTKICINVIQNDGEISVLE